MSGHDAFERILTSLHEAMLDDVHWPTTTALIDEACGLTSNALLVGEGPKDDLRVGDSAAKPGTRLPRGLPSHRRTCAAPAATTTVLPEIQPKTLAEWQRVVDLTARLARVPASLIMRTERPKHTVLVTSRTEGNPCRHSRESEEVWTRVVTSVRSLGSSGFLINKKMMGCGRLCETALRAVLQARVGASCASTGAAASIAPAVVSPRAFG